MLTDCTNLSPKSFNYSVKHYMYPNVTGFKLNLLKIFSTDKLINEIFVIFFSSNDALFQGQ